MNCRFCGKLISKVLVPEGKDLVYGVHAETSFQVGYCDTCLTGFTFPDMQDDELSEYYPSEYEAYNPLKGMHGKVQRAVYKSDLNRIKRYSGKKLHGLSIFDIGAGRGEFLSICKDMKLQVMGSEMSFEGVKTAKSVYDIQLMCEYAEKINYHMKYDIISMRHVLEHLTDPRLVLINIFENGLSDGGTLFLKIPRLDSWESDRFMEFWLDYFLPRHRSHFTASGIKKLLYDVGFSSVILIAEYNPTVYDRSMFLENAQCMAAQMYRSMPKLMRLCTAMLLCLLRRNRGSGRMIVLATR